MPKLTKNYVQFPTNQYTEEKKISQKARTHVDEMKMNHKIIYSTN